MFTLALNLGRTVAEVLRTMSLSELYAWYVYNQYSPIGAERFDWLEAKLEAQVTNLFRTAFGGKRARLISAEDVVAKWEGPKRRRRSVRDLANRMRQWALAWNRSYAARHGRDS